MRLIAASAQTRGVVQLRPSELTTGRHNPLGSQPGRHDPVFGTWCRVNEVLLPGLQRGINWSGVLVQVKGWQRSFQPSMKFPIAAMRSSTEVKLPRRMAWRVMMPKKVSDYVQPRRRGRGEVQRDPRVLLQPRFDVLVLVRAVVVRDDVELPAG
jgi:hypothetical protein